MADFISIGHNVSIAAGWIALVELVEVVDRQCWQVVITDKAARTYLWSERSTMGAALDSKRGLMQVLEAV
jgi:hypothetical protein